MAGARGRKGSRQAGTAAAKRELTERFVGLVEAWCDKIETAVAQLKPSDADYTSVATTMRAFQPALLLARELKQLPSAPAAGEAAEVETPAAADPAAELRGLKLRTG